jgi:hypothetical protein
MTPDSERPTRRYSLFAKSVALTATQWTIYAVLLLVAIVCLVLSLATDLTWPRIVAPACLLVSCFYLLAVRKPGRTG